MLPPAGLLRELIFGEGRYARAGAPEPTLLPRLLRAASPELFARAVLSGELFHLAQRHPDLRADLLAAIADRLPDLSTEDRAALLKREPALAEYLPSSLLTEAAEMAEQTEDDDLAGMVRIKLGGRTQRDPASIVRSLLRSNRRPSPWRYSALLDVVTHMDEDERSDLLEELKALPDFPEQADVIAGIGGLMPMKARSTFLSLWMKDNEPALERDLGTQWKVWALTRIAPQLPKQQYTRAWQRALEAAAQLRLPWQRAEAVRHLVGTMRGPLAGKTKVGEQLLRLLPDEEPWRSHIDRYITTLLRGRWPIDRSTGATLAPPAHVFGAELSKLLSSAATARSDELQEVVGEGIGAVFERWSGLRTAQRAAPPPEEEEAEDFDLGISRGPRARHTGAHFPPVAEPAEEAPRQRIVSDSIARRNDPGGAVDPGQPLELGADYYYWMQIGEKAVPGALAPSPLPADLPSDAKLSVALFAPDGGFNIAPDQSLGRFRLHSNGSNTVEQQPAAKYQDVSDDILTERLLFPLRAPKDAGRFRLRANIYYEGLLIESRLIEASVGGAAPHGEPALTATVDYSLSSVFAARTLSGIESHRLSVLMNRNADGNHDFYFFSDAKKKKIHRAVTLTADLLTNTISEARNGLRKVSWGDEEEYTPEKKDLDRYQQARSLPDLRTDLAFLAARGASIYNAVVAKLGDDEAALTEALKAPGLMQISGIEGIGFVLPAAMIYDYPFRAQQRPFDQVDLCPEFTAAFNARTPLKDTPCFQGACPSREIRTTVCPSGFWGFRHALGLPYSLGQRKTDKELEPTIPYHDVPSVVVAVSTDPQFTRRLSHQQDIQGLRGEWIAEDRWALGDTTAEVIDLLAKNRPHLVYFYCHGGLSTSGSARRPYLSVGPLDDEIIVPETLGQEVRWDDPKPLVFINGCHTTALDADTVLGFVSTLVERCKASGVIGTEITVFEPLAGAFATAFWRLCLAGDVPIGEAVRQARLVLLQNGNPLGLVYTPFVFAGMKLKKVS